MAEALFRRGMEAADSEEERWRWESGLGHVLIARGAFDEARSLYVSLFERSGSHRHLHNRIRLERLAGDPEEALRVVAREREMLEEADDLAWGANLYEEAATLEAQGAVSEALEAANRCLERARRAADEVMLGCAFRILGDVERHRSVEAARRSYEAARAAFVDVGEVFAVAEIEERLGACEAGDG